LKNLFLPILEQGIDLKLAYKIYLLQFFLALILFGFLSFVYLSYEKQYKKEINSYVTLQAKSKKEEILRAVADAKTQLEQQKKLYFEIHKTALNILQKNPNINLNTLKKQLHERFHLINTKIELYLINKHYTIFKTTYTNDLGFNLGMISDAKELLDKTSIDKKIHIADIVSIDALDMNYKLYSYSYLREGVYLELGFTNKNIYNFLPEIIENNPNISIYSIEKNKKAWYYYKLSVRKTVKEKKNLYKSIKKFPFGKEDHYDTIMHAHFWHKTFTIERGTTVTVITPLYTQDMYREIGRSDLVMEIKIDIADKLAILKKTKNIFIFSLILVGLFLLSAFFYIRNSFTKKIELIEQSMHNKKPIDDAALLQNSDELATITKTYNTLFASLNKEIIVNKKLLEENKRFIADTVHQIRTPLTNIMMNSEMIKRMQKDNAIVNFTDQINASINMLTNSYEDLSYILSCDNIEYKASQISLSELLRERVQFFTTISKVNFKEIHAEITEKLFVVMNQIELERLIDNNISNAIKYADAHKAITIILTQEEKEIVLQFQSFGKAIENREKLFEKNYRENESKRGLGLGLNMVKNICEKYEIKYLVSYENGRNIFTYKFLNCYNTQ
jgi:signal transduction histidine kinase